MEEGKSVSFSTREVVASKIVAQLEKANQTKKKELMMQLLEHMHPLYVQALSFAYDVVPKQQEGE